jgi:hypothetical protein
VWDDTDSLARRLGSSVRIPIMHVSVCVCVCAHLFCVRVVCETDQNGRVVEGECGMIRLHLLADWARRFESQ